MFPAHYNTARRRGIPLHAVPTGRHRGDVSTPPVGAPLVGARNDAANGATTTRATTRVAPTDRNDGDANTTPARGGARDSDTVLSPAGESLSLPKL